MLKRTIQAAVIVLILFFSIGTGLAQDPGADTFKAKCMVCHGADGQGNQMGKALGVVPYNAPEVRKMSNVDLAAIVKNGKNNKMPAFGGQLTDEQIKGVVKYIRTLQK